MKTLGIDKISFFGMKINEKKKQGKSKRGFVLKPNKLIQFKD